MISYEQFYEIHFCAKQLSMSPEQIGAKLSLSPTTVRNWLKRDSFSKSPSQRERKSKLDPFKEKINELLRQCPDFSGAQILHLIQKEGFTGGKTILNDYLKKIRPSRRKAYLSLHFPAGECAQVDWGVAGYIEIDGCRRKVSYFVMVLCYSRMMYVQFTLGESQEFWLECHRNAFEYFGGVPRKVMVDNCKTAILEHLPGRDIKYNPHYVDFAGHYGFRIVACNVRQPQEKGRVENGVGFVRKSFLKGRRLEPFELLNIEIRDWLDNTASQRIHGTTGRKPVDMLTEEKLQPLPLENYHCSQKVHCKVNKLFRVRFAGNTYSVPAEYAFEQAVIEVFTDKIIVWSKGRVIAEHKRYFGSKKDIENPAHAARLIEQRKRAEEQKLFNWLLRLSHRAEEFLQELKKRSVSPINDIRKIASLAQVYSEQEISQALEDSLQFGACSAEYILNILEQKQRLLPEPGPLHVSHKTDLLNIETPVPDFTVYEDK